MSGCRWSVEAVLGRKATRPWTKTVRDTNALAVLACGGRRRLADRQVGSCGRGGGGGRAGRGDWPVLPDDGVVAAVAAASRLAAWAAGVEVAGDRCRPSGRQVWRGVGTEGGAPELLSARDLAAAEVAAAFSVSQQGGEPGGPGRRPGPAAGDPAGAGRWPDRPGEGGAIVDAVAALDDDAAAAVEARVLARAPGQTVPNLKAVCAGR